MPAAQTRLETLLGLSPLGSQDWELELADMDRLGEFVDLYDTGTLNDDERFALMALIVASWDDYISAGRRDDSLETRIQTHLAGEFELHESTIRYWSQEDETEPEALFSITPSMRVILRLHMR